MSAQTFANDTGAKRHKHADNKKKSFQQNPEKTEFDIYQDFLPKSTEIERFDAIRGQNERAKLQRKQQIAEGYSSQKNSQSVTKRSTNLVQSSRVDRRDDDFEYGQVERNKKAEEARYSDMVGNTSRSSSHFSEFVPNDEMKNFYRQEFQRSREGAYSPKETELVVTHSNSKDATNSMASSKLTYGVKGDSMIHQNRRAN